MKSIPDHKQSPFQASHWPAFTVQEDRAAASTQGLIDGRQAERGGERVRVWAHGAVPAHFVRQLTGAFIALVPCRRQLLLIWYCLYRQAVALCWGAAGNVPLLILIFLLCCWVTGVGSGGDVAWYITDVWLCTLQEVYLNKEMNHWLWLQQL